MSQEFLNLNKSNLNIFFEILSISKIEGLVNYSIDISTFEKYLKLLNIKEKNSFILQDEKRNIGLFLATLQAEKAYIPAIAVLKNYQGRGYGKILLQKGISLLVESDVKTVSLDVEMNNSQAINLYKSEGFKISNEILSFRNENNSFYTNSLILDKQFKIENIDSLTFQILYKNFYSKTKRPWQKNFNYLQSKLENDESQISIIYRNSDTWGYFIISRKVNTLQIDDFALKEYDINLFGYMLSKLIKNEKIVQINNLYRDDPACDLILKNNFYIDLKQYEMKREIK
jgi:[ribosomal protein S18]-alanine N-acetyltransferase